MKRSLKLTPVHIRVLAFLIILALLITALSITQYLKLRNAVTVTAVDQLSGQRIGCCIGWETDLILTSRNDLTLLRYDTNAEAVIALGFGQIDAFSADECCISAILQATEGLETLPEPIARIGMTLCTSLQSETLLEDFNEFAAEFIKSDDYQDFQRRSVLSDGKEYVLPDIPRLTDGKPITVGYIPSYYPQSFLDTKTGEASGFSAEIVLRFAYEYGYTVNFIECSESNSFYDLLYNKVDMVVGGFSDVYRESIEASEVGHMSEPFVYNNVLLIKLKEGQKLVMKGEIST